jgi:hypothetical protein
MISVALPTDLALGHCAAVLGEHAESLFQADRAGGHAKPSGVSSPIGRVPLPVVWHLELIQESFS